jgi:hypothetical protein
MAQVKATQQEVLDETRGSGGKMFSSTTGPLLLYWVFCLAVGLLVLHDEIFSWRIPEAWGKAPFFLAYAVLITVFNEWAYIKIARHDGRPLRPALSVFFTLVNGVLEAFAFMAFYRLFEQAANLVFPNVTVVTFIFGFIGFVVYSGIAHALFWARLLPRHFSSAPELQRLRKAMGLIQALIVLGWCLYFQSTGDLWTLVVLHMLIDGVLMVRVRPPLFEKLLTAS